MRNVLLAASLTALAFTGSFSYAVIRGKITIAPPEQSVASGDYLEEVASAMPVKRGRK